MAIWWPVDGQSVTPITYFYTNCNVSLQFHCVRYTICYMMKVRAVNGEYADALNLRLRQEGRYKLYQLRRRQLLKAGLVPNEAWISAAQEFPPPGIEPIYRTDIDDEGIHSGLIKESQIAFPQKKGMRMHIMCDKDPVQPKARETVEKQPDAPSPFKAAKVNVPPEILELYKGQQVFTPRQDVEWVHLNLAFQEPNWETAPSSGALALYAFAKRQEVIFYSLFKNFVPTLKETNAAQRFEDDGRDITDLIDRVAEAQSVNE